MDWDKEIENLKKLVFQDKLSYEEIGRMYGCTGSNIKRVMKRRGIELLIRSKNANKEPTNKGKKKYFCVCCGNETKHTPNANIVLINVSKITNIKNGLKNIKKITLQPNLLYGDRFQYNYADIFLKNSIINVVNAAGAHILKEYHWRQTIQMVIQKIILKVICNYCAQIATR